MYDSLGCIVWSLMPPGTSPVPLLLPWGSGETNELGPNFVHPSYLINALSVYSQYFYIYILMVPSVVWKLRLRRIQTCGGLQCLF